MDSSLKTVNCEPMENGEQKTQNMPERHKIREAGSQFSVLSLEFSDRRPVNMQKQKT
jgi:hypothetical protein